MFISEVKLSRVNQLDQVDLIKLYSKEVCPAPYTLQFFLSLCWPRNIQEISSKLLREQAAREVEKKIKLKKKLDL